MARQMPGPPFRFPAWLLNGASHGQGPIRWLTETPTRSVLFHRTMKGRDEGTRSLYGVVIAVTYHSCAVGKTTTNVMSISGHHHQTGSATRDHGVCRCSATPGPRPTSVRSVSNSIATTTSSRRFWTSGTGPRTPTSKCARTMATFISFATTPRQTPGHWNPSAGGRSWAAVLVPVRSLLEIRPLSYYR